jgi:hypothetical protein
MRKLHQRARQLDLQKRRGVQNFASGASEYLSGVGRGLADGEPRDNH